jgi:hypothetical protein
MSTVCRFAADVLIADLFDGRLEHRGITEYKLAETDGRARVLTDGKNYLWVFAQEDGRVVCLTRYGLNWVEEIVESIEQELGIRIYTEYEPQFWGFENQADWDAWHEKTAREHDDWFYGQILRFIAGEPHELVEGTMAMAQAVIARTLVSEDASLGARENREKLLAAVEEDRRNPQRIVRLDIAEIEKQIAEARLANNTGHPYRGDFFFPVQ